MPLENDARPEYIEDHGTRVVLLGNSEDSNTMQAPPKVPSPSRWISKYLNSRYFRFPSDVTIKAREGWENPRSDAERNYLRTITGQEIYLSKHMETSGTVQLTNALAHWWILKDEKALSSNSGFIESSGHIGALYQDEIYELSTARSGMSRLQQFGVVFGYKYVVIYVEPQASQKNSLTTNTARTTLLINGASAPWSIWATEFREKLPLEIAELVAEKAAAAANTDHSKSIRDRLKDIMDLFNVSRYRPTEKGKISVDDEQLTRGGLFSEIVNKTNPSEKKRVSDRENAGSQGNLYAMFEKSDGIPADSIKPDPFPQVHWVSVKNGTREPGILEDRAAKYIPDQNLLMANSDFRVFEDMIKALKNIYKQVPGI
jgi:hypothetical protein